MIDDTSIDVSPALAMRLRSEAFLEDGDPMAASETGAPGSTVGDGSIPENADDTTASNSPLGGDAPDARQPRPDDGAGSVVATLKALILAWDEANAARARKVMEAADAGEASPLSPTEDSAGATAP